MTILYRGSSPLHDHSKCWLSVVSIPLVLVIQSLGLVPVDLGTVEDVGQNPGVSSVSNTSISGKREQGESKTYKNQPPTNSPKTMVCPL